MINVFSISLTDYVEHFVFVSQFLANVSETGVYSSFVGDRFLLQMELVDVFLIVFRQRWGGIS